MFDIFSTARITLFCNEMKKTFVEILCNKLFSKVIPSAWKGISSLGHPLEFKSFELRTWNSAFQNDIEIKLNFVLSKLMT